MYDVDTTTDQDKDVMGSLKTKFHRNPDGSIGIYFGPNSPVDKEDRGSQRFLIRAISYTSGFTSASVRWDLETHQHRNEMTSLRIQ